MLNLIVKIILLGWIVLVGAIVVNGLINASPWLGWYEYFNKISEMGFLEASKALSILNILFLYVGYPFLLGALAYGGKYLLSF